MKSGKALKIFTIITGVLTAAISGVMNFWFIPIIEDGPVTRCFDMNLTYNYWQAEYFLSCLTDLGKNVYLYRQLPLDFIYPVVYCAFFILLFRLLMKKKSLLFLLPALLAAADYCENVGIYLMLKSETLGEGVVLFSSVATKVKTALMLLCFLTAIILLLKNLLPPIIKKQREKNAPKKAEKQQAAAKKAAEKQAEKEKKAAEQAAAAQTISTEEDAPVEENETEAKADGAGAQSEAAEAPHADESGEEDTTDGTEE